MTGSTLSCLPHLAGGEGQAGCDAEQEPHGGLGLAVAAAGYHKVTHGLQVFTVDLLQRSAPNSYLPEKYFFQVSSLLVVFCCGLAE